MDGWYVLEASAPHRCRMPVRDNALPVAVAAGESLAADYFRGWLSYRALFGQWFLRLWWTARPPESLWEVDRVAARGECLLAVGPLDEVVVELRHTVDGVPHRYRIARRVAPDSSSRTVRFGLGHAVTARADEVFDVDAAAELFCAYYRTGTVPSVEYVLRELDSPDVLTDFGAQTHVLTVEYDQLRPVLATVADGEFAKVLQEFDVDAGFAVLVLSPLPPGRTWAELAGDEATGTEEFVQAAGSGGRYLVEWRKWDGDDYRVFVIGRHATSPAESLTESMRRLGVLGEEIRALRVSMDRTVDSINVQAVELASVADFPEIKSAEIVYSEPTTALEYPEPTTAPLPVTEAAEIRHSDPTIARGHPEPTTAPLPITEAAEIRQSEPTIAPPPMTEVAPIFYSEPSLAPPTAHDSANSAVLQPGPIDEPLAPDPADASPHHPSTEDIPITFDGHLQHVHPNEVFTPAEVDLLLVHYTRTGTLPDRGYSYREITLDS
ncbi:hypothetical protein ACFWF7_34655 [Nocardia sp. NPDC060256]|uniref:hypothetical protein n=1 Tax=unclassified Nocardia TaxID=2637762 RepID=UPI003661080A